MFSKYLFGLIVASYVIMVMGIPVYLHYCGGELEKINYVLKSESCCGGEEDDTAQDDGCCKDENFILKNTADFTLKQSLTFDPFKNFSTLFFIRLPFTLNDHVLQTNLTERIKDFPPPPVQNGLVISISVLRI